MSYFLRLDEMLEVVRESEMPNGGYYADAAQALANLIAKQLAVHLGIKAEVSPLDLGMMGATFSPAHEDQPLPQVMAELAFDDINEWGSD